MGEKKVQNERTVEAVERFTHDYYQLSVIIQFVSEVYTLENTHEFYEDFGLSFPEFREWFRTRGPRINGPKGKHSYSDLRGNSDEGIEKMLEEYSRFSTIHEFISDVYGSTARDFGRFMDILYNRFPGYQFWLDDESEGVSARSLKTRTFRARRSFRIVDHG